MNSNIRNIIPVIYEAMGTDQENDSQRLFNYYRDCNEEERAAINTMLICLCGWSFETILEKCGINVLENGEPVIK